MVLNGRARFYTEDNEIVAEAGTNEDVLIPHGFKYWFESTGEDPLEILHVTPYAEGVEDERIDHEDFVREENQDVER